MMYRLPYLVEDQIFKNAGFLQVFPFYGLAWSYIEILTPDLDSPENLASDDV